MSRSKSVFEDLARAEKVARLTNVMDYAAVRRGIDPLRHADAIVSILRHLPDDGWRWLEAKAELKSVASPTTREALIAVYQERDRVFAESGATDSDHRRAS